MPRSAAKELYPGNAGARREVAAGRVEAAWPPRKRVIAFERPETEGANSGSSLIGGARGGM